jgi:hypothetical protein
MPAGLRPAALPKWDVNSFLVRHPEFIAPAQLATGAQAHSCVVASADFCLSTAQKRRLPRSAPALFRSMHMRDRVQQESQKRQGQDDESPFAPLPLKRQKQETPHGSDLLQVFTASR